MPDRLSNRRVHLVRHPPPDIASGVCYGQTDVRLIDAAELAATRLRPQLPENYRTICSPLQRCHLLACALADKPQTDKRLMEMHFGDWENRRWDDIPRNDIDEWATAPFDYTPPRGESATEMAARVRAFAADLPPGPGEDLLIISHQGPLRILIAHWLDLPRESWLKLQLDFAASSCLELADTGNRLRWLNR